jgi:hypothetical protein
MLHGPQTPTRISQMRAVTGSLPLPLTAQRLGTGWGTAYRLLLSGELRGQQEGGRWMVETSSIEEYEKRQQQNERAR